MRFSLPLSTQFTVSVYNMKQKHRIRSNRFLYRYITIYNKHLLYRTYTTYKRMIEKRMCFLFVDIKESEHKLAKSKTHTHTIKINCISAKLIYYMGLLEVSVWCFFLLFISFLFGIFAIENEKQKKTPQHIAL